jgi:hypothetical protein
MVDANPMGQGPCDHLAEVCHDQGVVLIHVLAVHPTHLRMSDLVQELAGGSADFAESDRIENAVRELAGVGLLFRCQELILPTRAALRFEEVWAVGA